MSSPNGLAWAIEKQLRLSFRSRFGVDVPLEREVVVQSIEAGGDEVISLGDGPLFAAEAD